MRCKIFVWVILMILVVTTLGGCALSTSESATKHLNLHLLKAYRDLVELHREIDWFWFDLDEEDPDLY
jgi:hypothetical protein